MKTELMNFISNIIDDIQNCYPENNSYYIEENTEKELDEIINKYETEAIRNLKKFKDLTGLKIHDFIKLFEIAHGIDRGKFYVIPYDSNIEKIKEMESKYKELGFNDNYNEIANRLLDGHRTSIKARDKEHKKELIEFYFSERHNSQIIVDFECLGHYMIYENDNLKFKPCKLVNDIKCKWVEEINE